MSGIIQMRRWWLFHWWNLQKQEIPHLFKHIQIRNYSCMPLGSSPRIYSPHFIDAGRRGIYSTKSNLTLNGGVHADSDNLVISSKDEFQEIMRNDDIWRLTAVYWRSLRFTKPLVVSCNVDKSVESRMNDCILACGASCQNTDSLDNLQKFLLTQNESQKPVGCYIVLNATLLESLGAHTEKYESISKECNSILVDLVNCDPSIFKQLLDLISVLKPNVVRFCDNKFTLLANNYAEYSLSGNIQDDEQTQIEQCQVLARLLDATIIDNSKSPIVATRCGSSAVVFPPTLDILNRIHGYDLCLGGIITSMLSMASSQDLFAPVSALAGVDFVADQSSKLARGPGTMLLNLIDSLYQLSKSPDNVQEHKSEVRFFKT